MLSRLLLGAVALAASVPAAAAWHKASSPHFIIYADEDPDRLRAFATKLERFDAAVRLVRDMKDPPVGDGNRLTVFVANSVSDVHELQRGVDKGTVGFFVPRASGSVAIVPRSSGTKHDIDPEVVFFHEYAHHLMFSDLATPYPTWLVEGFAEFYSTANVAADGTVGFGEAPVHRKAALLSREQPLSMEALLTATSVQSGPERAALYSRGWLLTHYLTFAPDRRGQLESYLGEIARGGDKLAAARAAFGDLAKLERDVNQYLDNERFPYLTLPRGEVKSAEVKIEALGSGAESVMPFYMRLQARTDANTARQAERARALAAAHPGSFLAVMALAEAEWVVRDYRASEAAADKAIALMPQSAEALIWKGRAVLARAEAKQPGASFADARSWFIRANKLDPENPEPLFNFYSTYQREGIAPTDNAIAALHYAADLAPHDMGLRITSAERYLADAQFDHARTRLIPVAYNPHGGRMAETAAAMIARIDAGGGKAREKTRVAN